MRGVVENVLIISFLLTNLLLAYYIAANTVWSQTVLPNVNVKGVSADLSQEELQRRVSSKAMQELPETLQVNFLEEQYDVPLTTRIIKVKAVDSPAAYGKGANFFKVIEETAEALLHGINFNVTYHIDISDLLPNFGIYQAETQSGDTAYWHDGIARNCDTRVYDFDLDLQTYQANIDQALKRGKLDLSAQQLIPKAKQFNLLKSCHKYMQEYGQLKETFSEELGRFSDSLLSVDYNQRWVVTDKKLLGEIAENYVSNSTQLVEQGQYEVMDDYIAMLEPYQEGKTITQEEIVTAVENWLVSPLDRDLKIKPRTITPDILKRDLPIYDFTKHLASGKTRLDKYRNGYRNIYLQYAEHGVREMQDQLIMPGEEFSYIERIQPQGGGRMASGRPIGGGICNSTTTLYRAALEAGFKITERNSHGFYVESYDWGYPLNIVDAAYYTPTSDLKFVNNLDYPVLLRIKVTGDDTWQYHTINVYTSSDSVDREVKLTNWKKWNVYSATQFSGSFERIVLDNGEVVRKDDFYTRYY